MRALTELKKECFRRIGSDRCFCCGELKLKRLLAHHLSYTSKSVTYDKWGNSDDERLKYHSNLLDEIKLDPGNFLVMCFNCHKELEKLLRLSYDEVLLLARQRKIREMMILAYNLTRNKRNLKTLKQPEDEITPPNFIIEFDNKWRDKLFSNGLDFLFLKESLYDDIHILFNKIETKSLSLCDFSQSVILSEPPENYIMSIGYVTAFRILESIMDIKKGDKILYVHIINHPYYKPIELVRKEEINAKYYFEWFERHIINISNGLITKSDLDKLSGRPLMTGLDEFFWS